MHISFDYGMIIVLFSRGSLETFFGMIFLSINLVTMKPLCVNNEVSDRHMCFLHPR
jgi:hypothetical protein